MQTLITLVISGLTVGCIYAIVALGFVLIYKATDTINFAQGDLMMLGAMVGVTFIATLKLPYIVGVLLAAISMGIFGWLLELGLMRHVIGKPHLTAVILTIAIGYVMRSGAGLVWGYQPLAVLTPFSGQVAHIGSTVVSGDRLAVIGGTAVLCGSIYSFFRFTRIGIAMQATAQNRFAAYLMGIRVRRVFAATWATSAALSAIAGILFIPIALADVNMGALGLKAYAAAILGGFGSISGALVASLMMGVVEQFAARYLPTGMHEVTGFVFLFAVLVVRPQGLFPQSARSRV
ncbi:MULTISPECIES: branched-chain amino acid ABC transporter permease [unclassified Variovorax]|uniref:branched-chain amino acid ABC transporter permease n=1 Tax=unclassified Variovorax TaxID=663243 RepID=UPI001BD3753F|nr:MULTISPECIES: branched-chain amino acid ABC transporter permease [unclassified Variovorax]